MSNNNESTSEAFNIKEFILSVLSYKYLYVASFVICLAVAFLINKFSPDVYEVTSIIGPVEDKRSTLLESNDMFRGQGSLRAIKKPAKRYKQSYIHSPLFPIR